MRRHMHRFAYASDERHRRTYFISIIALQTEQNFSERQRVAERVRNGQTEDKKKMEWLLICAKAFYAYCLHILVASSLAPLLSIETAAASGTTAATTTCSDHQKFVNNSQHEPYINYSIRLRPSVPRVYSITWNGTFSARPRSNGIIICIHALRERARWKKNHNFV